MYEPTDMAARAKALDIAKSLFEAIKDKPTDTAGLAKLYGECIAHAVKLDRETGEAIAKHR
jgi:hypothetical protein